MILNNDKNQELTCSNSFISFANLIDIEVNIHVQKIKVWNTIGVVGDTKLVKWIADVNEKDVGVERFAYYDN